MPYLGNSRACMCVYIVYLVDIILTNRDYSFLTKKVLKQLKNIILGIP